MRVYAYAFATLLATYAVSFAEPPKPGGPYKVALNEVTEIEITEVKPGTLGFHNPYDPAVLFIREATPRREGSVSFIVQPKTPDLFRLTVWTEGEKQGRTLFIDATSGLPPVPPKPDPPVPPGPNPPKPDPPGPTPTPITSDHWFIVLEETSQRTPEQALLLDFRKWDTLGAKYRFYDVNSPDTKAQGYDKLVSTLGLKLPVLFVFDKAGKVVDSRELPKTFEEIKKIRTGFGGTAPPPPGPPPDGPPVYKDSSQIMRKEVDRNWGIPPSIKIANVPPTIVAPDIRAANVSTPVKVQANPFELRPARDSTLATIAPTVVAPSTRLQATIPVVRTITGATGAGLFGITNCVSG